MISLEIIGIDTTKEYLGDVSDRASSDETYQDTLQPFMERQRRFAVGISPVDTGSYRGSHRVSVDGMAFRLHVDPRAKNEGRYVHEYALFVEALTHVYARTAVRTGRRIPVASRDLLREVIG